MILKRIQSCLRTLAPGTATSVHRPHPRTLEVHGSSELSSTLRGSGALCGEKRVVKKRRRVGCTSDFSLAED